MGGVVDILSPVMDDLNIEAAQPVIAKALGVHVAKAGNHQIAEWAGRIGLKRFDQGDGGLRQVLFQEAGRARPAKTAADHHDFRAGLGEGGLSRERESCGRGEACEDEAAVRGPGHLILLSGRREIRAECSDFLVRIAAHQPVHDRRAICIGLVGEEPALHLAGR